MEFKFGALSQEPDEASLAAEERKIFAMEMAAEGADTAKPAMTEPGAEASPAGETAPSQAAQEPGPEEEAMPVTAAKADAEGGTPPAADGEAAQAVKDEDEKKKEEENSVDALMRLAAGRVSSDEVKIEAAMPAVTASAFQTLNAARALDPEAERQLADLVETLAETPPPSSATDREPPAAPAPSRAAMPGQPHAQSMMTAAPVSGGVSGQLGELAGQAIAGALATPFIALTSAARHLRNQFKGAGVMPPAPARAAGSLAASKGGVSIPMLNTLETITDWKCERIERAADAVEKSASALMGTEEFVTWEDELAKTAQARGVSASEIVSGIASDAELTPLRERMDRLWEAHPDKVGAYRDACKDFERNIRNVVKEFANSEDDVKNRVTQAMKNVEEKTQALPGFGEKVGEYTKAIAERVRELATMIAEFVTELMRKLGGKTRNSDLSM